jgi:hypothetical protein
MINGALPVGLGSEKRLGSIPRGAQKEGIRENGACEDTKVRRWRGRDGVESEYLRDGVYINQNRHGGLVEKLGERKIQHLVHKYNGFIGGGSNGYGDVVHQSSLKSLQRSQREVVCSHGWTPGHHYL